MALRSKLKQENSLNLKSTHKTLTRLKEKKVKTCITSLLIKYEKCWIFHLVFLHLKVQKVTKAYNLGIEEKYLVLRKIRCNHKWITH